MRYALLAVGLVVLAQNAAADANKFLKAGFIRNDRGQKCTYTQSVDTNSTYFNAPLTGEMGTIVFDDARCMAASEFGLDVNKMMINNVIALWYSHDDAKFGTKVSELRAPGALQKRGQCIQSATYPIIGITVEYEVANNSVIRVRHGQSAQGCKK